ncbi:hypothetical protein Skr01_31470 [Sphaerisporangium krabiense]|uniref:Uncharacterized protein n=1 Tax=Sphaerisporangium krabiense TaxID=763782 RepID=A0A7W8Z1A5_9ACTN|nr:hypothetical protein [Sphaerisporangium krabiense]MBB5625604.1 hypothetical protein [Sphaerisporangium krabiense]GII63062.1 hypothetical protein Skr01_31470 [Sphaerisporangium krabiense]
MNASTVTSANIAEEGATVGVQTEALHGDVYVYQLPPDATPQQKFEVGVKCLRGGMSARAREYISDAVVQGHVTSRSCFYLLLALLSGRTLQQVPKEDLDVLRSVQARIVERPGDTWVIAVRMLSDLLTSLQTGSVDSEAIERDLQALGTRQRDEIFRHLEMLLSGPALDGLWARAFASAKAERCDYERLRRVWKFFQPEPIGARVRSPRPAAITVGDWIRSIATTMLSLTSVSFIGAVSWQHAWSSTALALPLFTAGCHACARHGVEWRFRVQRRQEKDRQHWTAGQRPIAAPQGGFANQIDRQFDYYFARYVPRNTDRAEWLTRTAAIRRCLRDEVVELYRESRVDAKRVAWLTRYLVSDVKGRWQDGTLWDYRDRLRVTASMKVLFTLGVAALIVGGAMMTWSALYVRPLSVVGATVVAIWGGWIACATWLRIILEHKRLTAEQAEADLLLAERRAAFERWKSKLADKPTDLEMAHWLDCDRKALMEEAMRHYKLAAADVIAHAFIEAPASYYKRARVRKGPWRYSRYKLLTFLLTADGVRQLTVELDFEKATFHDRARINYRYDAVAAVEVTEADDGHKTFELTLVNGHPIEVEVTGPPPGTDQLGEDTRMVSQATLDTAGLGNTLHILEGVAAEGKEWIRNERERERVGSADLADAARRLLA